MLSNLFKTFCQNMILFQVDKTILENLYEIEKIVKEIIKIERQ